MRRCTSLAPASRSMRTIWRVVLPRTIESSTTTRRLPLHHLGQRVELHPQAVVAQLLAGLDERARDVAVLDQPVVLRDAGCAREALRRGVAGVGDRDHEVGLDRRLAGEDLAHPAAHRLERAALELGVGAREVDVLEHAQRAAGRTRPPGGSRCPRSPIETSSPGCDLAHQLGADDVERAALGGDHVAARRARPGRAAAAPAGSRKATTESLGHDHGRVGARAGVSITSATASSIRSAGWRAISAAMISESEVERKRDALGRQLVVELDRVDEVAVVGERDRAAVVAVDGLRVVPAAAAGGRVAHVADRRCRR